MNILNTEFERRECRYHMHYCKGGKARTIILLYTDGYLRTCGAVRTVCDLCYCKYLGHPWYTRKEISDELVAIGLGKVFSR